MITSAIGKIFLDAFNREYGTQYDARSFFIEQFHPLFFDHNKYMMTAGNAPLENPKISWDDMIRGTKPYETQQQRNERFEKLIKKMDNNIADASVARAYPSTDVNATTSGQVTNLSLPLSTEDIYASWLGDALAVGIQGGISILFSHHQILLDIYRGWQLYRQCLNNTSNLKGNQINTWNGQWLSHLYDSKVYDHKRPLANFNPFVMSKNDIMSLETQSWTKVLIGIARKYANAQLMGYIYSIGQTNTTIGFIPFDLSGIRKPIHLYKKLFGDTNSRNAEALWGTAHGFRKSCTAGTIGIKAMEPKGMRDYIDHNKLKMPKAPKNENETISINVYKIWILAMLNNEQLWEKSQELAKLLNDASVNTDKAISTKRKNLVENVLKAPNKKQFIVSASEIVSFISDIERFKEIVKEVNSMPTDNVPYFLALVRFQYNTI